MSLLEETKERLTYSASFVRLFSASIVGRKRFFATTIATKDGMIFLIICSLLSYAISGPIKALMPALLPYYSVRTSPPTLLWVAPDYSEYVGRRFISSQDITVWLGVLVSAWGLLTSVLTMFLIAVVLQFRTVRRFGYERTLVNLGVPVVAGELLSIICATALALTMLSAKVNNGTWLVVLAIAMLGFFWGAVAVPYLALRHTLGFTRFQSVLGVVAAGALPQLWGPIAIDPMQLVRQFTDLERVSARTTILLQEGHQFAISQNFPDAIARLKTAAEIAPHNIEVESLAVKVAHAYFMDELRTWRSIKSDLNLDFESTPAIKYRQWLSALETASQHHPNLSSVQLWIGEEYMLANQCRLAETQYKTVLVLSSLPHERALAASRLRTCVAPARYSGLVGVPWREESVPLSLTTRLRATFVPTLLGVLVLSNPERPIETSGPNALEDLWAIHQGLEIALYGQGCYCYENNTFVSDYLATAWTRPVSLRP